ncbi:MAG: metallophosphoesterase [Bacillota bacterium]|nr:metallophosphoesterase [Bacillota bacterium]
MKKERKYFKLSIIIVTILVFTVYCYIQNNWIETQNIKIEINNLPEGLNGLKIAQVSDVHLRKNTSSIDNIINIVKKEKPDIIVMTGDIIDQSADVKTCGLERLCKGLSDIAKTYAVTGNHEIWNGNVDEWTSILTENNVDVVDDKIEIYTKNNKSIAILGIKDASEYKPSNFKDINKVKDMPRILLAHQPELFTSSYSSSLNSINPNLVFSGHAHGGQFRIPIINKGIVAPDQGLFPKYTSGLYVNNNVDMIVSRGLGNSIIPIRVNNRPHIPITILSSVTKKA